MDKERTLYVFHSPRRARERHVIWLPVDLLTHWGFWAGALMLVGGVVGAVVAMTSKRKEDADTLWYAVGIGAAGVAVLTVVHWLQGRGRRADQGPLVVRRQPGKQ